MISEAVHYGRSACFSGVGGFPTAGASLGTAVLGVHNLGGTSGLGTGVFFASAALLRQYRNLVFSFAPTVLYLPLATQLPLGGPIAWIVNTSGSSIPIKSIMDPSVTIATLATGSLAEILLSGYNGSAAGGNWRVKMRASGSHTFSRATRATVANPFVYPAASISCSRAKYKLTRCDNPAVVFYTNSEPHPTVLQLGPYVGRVFRYYETGDYCWTVSLWNEVAPTTPIVVNVSHNPSTLATLASVQAFDDCSDCASFTPSSDDNYTFTWSVNDDGQFGYTGDAGALLSNTGWRPRFWTAAFRTGDEVYDLGFTLTGPIWSKSYYSKPGDSSNSMMAHSFAYKDGTVAFTGTRGAFAPNYPYFFPIVNGLRKFWKDGASLTPAGTTKQLDVLHGDLIEIGYQLTPDFVNWVAACTAAGALAYEGDGTFGSASFGMSAALTGTNGQGIAKPGTLLSIAPHVTNISGRGITKIFLLGDAGVPWAFETIPNGLTVSPRQGIGPAIVTIDSSGVPSPHTDATQDMGFRFHATVNGKVVSIRRQFTYTYSGYC